MENLHPHFMPDVSCCWVEIPITECMVLSSCDKFHNCKQGCDQCKPPTNKKKPDGSSKTLSISVSTLYCIPPCKSIQHSGLVITVYIYVQICTVKLVSELIAFDTVGGSGTTTVCFWHPER